jgi:ParB family chromosome partitioning protein
MSKPAAIRDVQNVVSLQERRLDRTVLRTYRKTADIDDLVPNNNQPRIGPKADEE